MEPKGDAVVSVFAKLCRGPGAGAPSIACDRGKVVTIGAHVGSFAWSTSAECDGAFSETDATEEAFSSVAAPVLAALLAGTNACLLVAANDGAAMLHVCSPAGTTEGLSTFMLLRLWQALLEKRDALVSLGVEHEASMYLTGLAVDDQACYDLIASRKGALSQPLRVVDTNAGSAVQGATSVGPVTSTTDILELIEATEREWQRVRYNRAPVAVADASVPTQTEFEVRYTQPATASAISSSFSTSSGVTATGTSSTSVRNTAASAALPAGGARSSRAALGNAEAPLPEPKPLVKLPVAGAAPAVVRSSSLLHRAFRVVIEQRVKQAGSPDEILSAVFILTEVDGLPEILAASPAAHSSNQGAVAPASRAPRRSLEADSPAAALQQLNGIIHPSVVTGVTAGGLRNDCALSLHLVSRYTCAAQTVQKLASLEGVPEDDIASSRERSTTEALTAVRTESRSQLPMTSASELNSTGSSRAESPALQEARKDLVSTRDALFAAFPVLASDRSVPIYEVTPLIHLLKDALIGNCATAALFAIATSGVPYEVSLAVLDVAATLRKIECFPLVNSAAVRGLMAAHRREIAGWKSAVRELQKQLEAERSGRVEQADQQSSAKKLPSLLQGAGGRPPKGASLLLHAASSSSLPPPRRDSGESAQGLMSATGTVRRARNTDNADYDYDADLPTAAAAERRGDARYSGLRADGSRSVSRASSDAEGGSTARGELLRRPGSGGEALALRYEEDLVSLSAQLLESELENARLRGALSGDARGAVERMDAAAHAAREAEAAEWDASAALAALRADAEETAVEMESLRGSLRGRVTEVREGRERIAALQQQVRMLEGQLEGQRAPFVPAAAATKGATAGVEVAALRKQVLDLFGLALALRARVAELSPVADERARLTRVEGVSVEDVLRDAPAVGVAVTAPYIEVSARLEAATGQNRRMRDGLQQASGHIRELRIRLVAAEEALAVTGAGEAAARVQSGLKAAQAANGALREQLAAYRTHLVRARDALQAAKRGRESAAFAAPGAADALAAGKLLEETRAQLLLLQERNGRLAVDNDRLRAALAVANESLSVGPGDASLGARYRTAVKRAGELQVANSQLQAQVEAANTRVRAAAEGFEKRVRGLLIQSQTDRKGPLAGLPAFLAPPAAAASLNVQAVDAPTAAL